MFALIRNTNLLNREASVKSIVFGLMEGWRASSDYVQYLRSSRFQRRSYGPHGDQMYFLSWIGQREETMVFARATRPTVVFYKYRIAIPRMLLGRTFYLDQDVLLLLFLLQLCLWAQPTDDPSLSTAD